MRPLLVNQKKAAEMTEEELLKERAKQGQLIWSLMEYAMELCDGDPTSYTCALLDTAAFGLRHMRLSQEDALELAELRITNNYEIMDDAVKEFPHLHSKQ